MAWIEGLLDALGAVRVGASGRRTWQCPAHDGNSPALRIRVGDRAALIYCHAGCPTDRVLARLALRREHLFRPPPGTPERYRLARLTRLALPPMDANGDGESRPQAYRHEAFHEYGRAHRKERLRHPTTGAKTCRWEARNPAGEWVPGLLGTRECDLPLYRETEIVAAVALGELVLVVESESSVDALRGWYATTWAGGAGSPHVGALRRVLADHDRVLIVPDNDAAGLACLAELQRALPLAHVLVPDLDDEDARDLYRRLGPDAFRTLVEHYLVEHYLADDVRTVR